MERKCVSINIGPSIADKVICELSDSDHLQHPEDLKTRPGWTYRGTEGKKWTSRDTEHNDYDHGGNRSP